MSRVYATRDATDDEVLLFRLLLSIYRDGSGAEREPDDSTRANWRQIERCVADLVDASTNEDKNIFDVTTRDAEDPTIYYGYSVKSKQLSPTGFGSLSDGGRVYMEIANSPAKFWDDIGAVLGLNEGDFRNQNEPEKIGRQVLNTVKKWQREEKSNFELRHPGCTLDLQNSNYFCLSYSKQTVPSNRFYQVHVFPLDYPEGIEWEYKSGKCLRGYDPAHPDEPLIDWYGVSGGQLKYYPKTSSARFASDPFQLLEPPHMSAFEKAQKYFPDFFDDGKLVP